MDDLSGLLEGFLSQPDAMAQLETMAKALGLDTGGPAQQESQSSGTGGLDDLISPAQLMALMGALNEASAPSESTALLEALRPLLGSERQEKLSRAIRAMQLMNAARSVSKALEKEGGHVQSLY